LVPKSSPRIRGLAQLWHIGQRRPSSILVVLYSRR
jgi:hypothetical protein